jgi:hypothetical protein
VKKEDFFQILLYKMDDCDKTLTQVNKKVISGFLFEERGSKMFDVISRLKLYIFTALFFSSLIILFIMSGCGDGFNPNSPSASTRNGSTSLSIRWHNTIEEQNNDLSNAATFDCLGYNVESVGCEVYDESNELLVSVGPWPCADGAGQIEGIKAGSNRTFVIMAEDGNDNILYQGTASEVTIEPEQTQNVVVDVYPFVPVLSGPPDGAILDPNAFRLRWQALPNINQYRVQISEETAFESPVIDETVSETTYVPTVLAASTPYYWRISAVNASDNIGAPSEARSFTTSNCTYTTLPDRNRFPIEGGPNNFMINTGDNCTFLATVSNAWITFTDPADGVGIGSIPFNYTVAANEDPAGRIGFIYLGGQRHIIIQSGTDHLCGFLFEPTSRNFNEMGGDGEINLLTTELDCPWTAASNSEWVRITDGLSGNGDYILQYTVDPNAEAQVREAIITVGDQTFTISQEGASAPAVCITSSISEQQFTDSGGDGWIEITASMEECQWTADSDVNWIQFDNDPPNTVTGFGSDSNVTFHVMANNETSVRTGTITVNGEAYTISQTGMPAACTYQIDPLSSGLFGIEGGTDHFNVLPSAENCSWSAVSSNPDWAVIISADVASGVVSYQVAPNDGIDPRNATITIQPNGPSYTISQAGQPTVPPTVP